MLKRSYKWRVTLKLLNFWLHAKKRAVRNVWCLWSTKKKPHYDDFTETHYTAAMLMAVSFNAIHKKCKASYSKTFEDIWKRTQLQQISIHTPEMYKNTIFRAYAYQPVGNRESWERKPTKHFGNQNYDAEKSEKILRSKVELKPLQHYNSSPLCAITFSGLVLSLSPTGGRWVRRAVAWGARRGWIYWSVWRATGRIFKQFSLR